MYVGTEGLRLTDGRNQVPSGFSRPDSVCTDDIKMALQVRELVTTGCHHKMD